MRGAKKAERTSGKTRRKPGKAPSEGERTYQGPTPRPEADPPQTGSEGPSPGLSTKRVYTTTETAIQVQLVESGLLQSMSEAMMLRQLANAGHDIGKRRLAKLVNKVQERWASEDLSRRPFWKAAQIRRLHRYIAQAGGKPATPTTKEVKPNHTAIARYEELLADVQGTREAISIDVNVRSTEALIEVLGAMSPEDLARVHREHKQTKALAAAAISVGLPPIDVAFEEAG